MANDCNGYPDCGPGSEWFRGSPAQGAHTIGPFQLLPYTQNSQGENWGITSEVDWTPRPRAMFDLANGYNPNFGASNALSWGYALVFKYMTYDGVCRPHNEYLNGDPNNTHFVLASSSNLYGTLHNPLPADCYMVTGLAFVGTVQAPYAGPFGPVTGGVRFAPTGAVGPNGGRSIWCPGTEPNISGSTKEAPATKLAGDPIEFKIIVRNSSTVNATGPISVVDTQPDVLNMVVTPAQIADVPPGGSATFTVNGTVRSGHPAGNLVNTAVLTPVDTRIAPKTVTSTTVITRPIVNVDVINTKTPRSTSVRPGAVGTYEWTIQNAGPETAVAIPIVDEIPQWVTLMEWDWTAAPGSSCSLPPVGAGRIAGTVTLPKDGYVRFNVNVTCDPTVPGTESQIVNTGIVTIPAGFTDTNTANNDPATGQIPIAHPGRIVTQKVANPSSVVAGHVLTYTVTIENTGVGPAVISVTDRIPQYMASWEWHSNVLAGVVTGQETSGTTDLADTGITIGPGGKLEYVFAGPIVTENVGSQIVNRLIVESDSGPRPDDKIVEIPILKPPVLNRGSTKTGPAEAYRGDTVTYLVTVKNTGDTAATNVTVTDVNPGFTDIVVTPVSVASIAGKGQAVFTVTAKVAADCPLGWLANVATIDAAEVEAFTVTCNTMIKKRTTVDLSGSTKTGPASAVIGQYATWTVTVRNSGDGDAHNVFVDDYHPLLFDMTVTPNNVTVPAGAEVTFTIRARVTDETTLRSLTNVASIFSSETSKRDVSFTTELEEEATVPGVILVNECDRAGSFLLTVESDVVAPLKIRVDVDGVTHWLQGDLGRIVEGFMVRAGATIIVYEPPPQKGRGTVRAVLTRV